MDQLLSTAPDNGAASATEQGPELSLGELSLGLGLGLLSSPPPLPSSILPSSDVAVVLTDAESTARIVEQVLERAGMSQREVARRLGIQPQSLNQYVRSRRMNPSVEWLARLVEVCGGQLLVRFPRG